MIVKRNILHILIAALLLGLLLLPVQAVEKDAWTEVPLSEIAEGTPVAITITDAGRTYLLTGGNGSQQAPEARIASIENGKLLCFQEDSLWTLSLEDGYVSICMGDQWLYTHNGNDGLRVGAGEDPRWSLRDGNLLHHATQRYLRVDTEGGIWQAKKSPAQGQTLRFWQRVPDQPPEMTQPSTRQPSPEPTAPTEAAPSPATPSTTEPDTGNPMTLPSETISMVPDASLNCGWHFYFGLLHAHTAISDGVTDVEEAFILAAQVENLDFFAVTDHSDSFDHAGQGSLSQDGAALSQDFAAGKAAAESVTTNTFVGIYGFEMSWPQGKNLGHIGCFGTPGWQSWKQEGFSKLSDFYSALAEIPSAVGQFNHPGRFYGDFERFSHYDAAYDAAMALLEVGGENGARFYEAYTQALDAGWHVAPTSSHNDHQGRFGDTEESRTVILAQELTEESLLEAMGSRRVYASDDGDLQIYYTLNDHVMGSILSNVSSVKIQVSMIDPSDSCIGQLEVVTDGGAVIYRQDIAEQSADLTIRPEAGHSYYYLRITQPDGDVAVTAPVWTDSLEDLGIGDFSADEALPIQGRELNLSVTVFNDEAQDLTLRCLTFSANGTVIHTAQNPGAAAARDTFRYCFPYTYEDVGPVEFQVLVEASAAGKALTWERSLTLTYHAPEMTGGILIDKSHGNFGTAALSRLTAIAAEADIAVEALTGPLVPGGEILVITAPAGQYSQDFGGRVRSFLDYGGTVVICGHPGKTAELNALLSGIGSTMAIGQRLSNLDRSCRYNEAHLLTKNLKSSQLFHHSGGCALDPGEGVWLVQDPESQSVLLAAESVGSGMILLSGSQFLSDKALPTSANRWDPVSANQGILEALLGVKKKELPLSTIAQVRQGQAGDVFRIQGYVTAGTSDPEKGFPGILCLQDSTGGIAVTAFSDAGIQVGTPLEVLGVRTEQDGNILLELIGCEILEKDAYRFVPSVIPCQKAMDYAARGGRLLQIQGKVKSVTLSDYGISRITLKDEDGGMATVVIEQKNSLASQIKKGSILRAMGILFLDDGQGILRVRNPEEVVYVAPRTQIPDGSNPKTG